MARMIGRAGGRRFTCGCCNWSVTKRGQIAKELRQEFKDLEAEMLEEDPYKPVDGYCCQFCRNEYSGALGTPEDLIGKEGISYL